MTLLYLPVELFLYVGCYLSHEDLISLATTSKAIRRIFMTKILGGTVRIRSPLPHFPGVIQLFDYLQKGLPDLQKCIDQVTFYRQHSDLARYVHTVQITNWIAPTPPNFWWAANELVKNKPEYRPILEILQSNQYYLHALIKFRSVYELIVTHLLQILPFSELELVRTHITPNMHITLQLKPTLRRLTLRDCTIEHGLFRTYTQAGLGGQYDLFTATSKVSNYFQWNPPWIKGKIIQVYLSLCCSTLTNLEVCIEFLRDDALDRLSFPSLTHLAIVPRMDSQCKMWSWGTLYRILKNSPNITYLTFDPFHDFNYVFNPFGPMSNWGEYKRAIGNLPLPRLSSITSYRQLLKRLVPGRPVSFVTILLFPEIHSFSCINWPESESDDEHEWCYERLTFVVPQQFGRSTVPIKTLYLQRVDEQQSLKIPVIVDDLEYLQEACPFLRDLWLPSLRLSWRRHRPLGLKISLQELRIFRQLERCAVGYCSPWLAKELEWVREGTIIRERIHPTLQELLLDVGTLWKWHDDPEITGWVLYVSNDIEGSEDSEEAIYPPNSTFIDADEFSGESEDDDEEWIEFTGGRDSASEGPADEIDSI